MPSSRIVPYLLQLETGLRPVLEEPATICRRLSQLDRQAARSSRDVQTGGVDFGNPVLYGRALDVVFDFAAGASSFEDDQLIFVESLRELGEIAPGMDAITFGACFFFNHLGYCSSFPG